MHSMEKVEVEQGATAYCSYNPENFHQNSGCLCVLHAKCNASRSMYLMCFLLQSKDNTFRGHTDSVDQLCWHPSNPDLLVTASGDKTVRLWDARSRKSVATVATKGAALLLCNWHTLSVDVVCCSSWP